MSKLKYVIHEKNNAMKNVGSFSKYRIALTLINRRIRPIRNTRTTRKSVGETGKSIIISSMRMPKMDASTSRKSNKFHGTVK